MVKQILVGLFVAGLGGVITYYSQAIVGMFGRIDRFERNMGSTRNGYVIVGFLIVVVGFLILFGVVPISQPVTEVVQPIT